MQLMVAPISCIFFIDTIEYTCDEGKIQAGVEGLPVLSEELPITLNS
jgi:hypothetical protein